MKKQQKTIIKPVVVIIVLAILAFLFSIYVEINTVNPKGQFTVVKETTIQQQQPAQPSQNIIPEQPRTQQTLIEDGDAVYVQGAGLVAKKSAESITYYHQDYLSSNRFSTGEDEKLSSKSVFYPYGSTLNEAGAVSSYKFTGQEKDDGLYYYGARYYDPSTARFLSIDPIFDATTTGYAYAANNPLKFVDPTGTENFIAVGLAMKAQTEVINIYYNQQRLQQNPDLAFDSDFDITAPPPRIVYVPSEEAQELENMAITVANYGGNFVPIVGDIKGIAEGIAGEDIQGNELTTVERALCIFCFSELTSGSRTYSVVSNLGDVLENPAVKLTTVQSSKVRKISEIEHNWRVRGTLSGEVVHEQKIREGVTGLTKARDSLGRSIERNNLDETSKNVLQRAYETANTLINQAEHLLREKGIL